MAGKRSAPAGAPERLATVFPRRFPRSGRPRTAPSHRRSLARPCATCCGTARSCPCTPAAGRQVSVERGAELRLAAAAAPTRDRGGGWGWGGVGGPRVGRGGGGAAARARSCMLMAAPPRAPDPRPPSPPFVPSFLPPPPLCAGSAQLYANARHKGGRGGLGGAERVPPACLPRETGRGGGGGERGGERGAVGGGVPAGCSPPPRRAATCGAGGQRGAGRAPAAGERARR